MYLSNLVQLEVPNNYHWQCSYETIRLTLEPNKKNSSFLHLLTTPQIKQNFSILSVINHDGIRLDETD